MINENKTNDKVVLMMFGLLFTLALIIVTIITGFVWAVIKIFF